MHDVVVIAVRKAVRAATMTFTATSTIRFFKWVREPSPDPPDEDYSRDLLELLPHHLKQKGIL